MPQPHWQNSRLCRLSACLAVLAIVWLIILPFIGQHPDIDAHIRRNEQLGIDPSAKFYTELPAMPELYERVQRRRMGNAAL